MNPRPFVRRQFQFRPWLAATRAFVFLLILLAWCIASRGQPVDVLPVRSGDDAQSLNGEWRFKYLPALDAGADEKFSEPSFDVAAWKTIRVPGHWELQGFAEPQYSSDVPEGLGLYRRAFRVPKEWAGQRVFLRFDGVLFGFTASVNGKPVGEWASGFNPATFDITDTLRPDAENVLAVRVTTRSKGWDFDTMDCWALSGIYRDVTLFALPQTHFRDYTARTELKPDGSAELSLEAVASSAAKVAGKLIAPDGKLAREFQFDLAGDGRGATKLAIEKPQLWTAESPWLYQLVLELKSGGATVQTFRDRIGLRQVTTTDGIFKLNGTPIKLRGINHHDMWPEGRVASEERMRRDLELMRDANINFIRTSHYPPHPRFIELCDEMGFYVDCEVPFIHGHEHLKDTEFQDALYARAHATVMRDKNRPSIILWSVGNENPVNELGLNTGKRVKELDPTRPITFPTMGSHFRDNWQRYPEFVDLYSPHYPSVKTLDALVPQLTRPIVVTEYAHQRGIARSGSGLQDIWEAMVREPRIAGGAVWHFQDQGILRTARDMRSVENGDLMVWLDEHRYFDTHGYYGVDGIVYSDRTPQTDYWQLRKVYSPVQVPERTLAAAPGEQTLTLHVENRHDFRSLAGMKLSWALRRNGASLQDGSISLNAKARETETVSLAVKLPEELGDDVFALDLRFADERGKQVHERSIQLTTGAENGKRSSALQKSLPAAEPVLETTDAAFVVRHAKWRLTLDRATGQLSIADANGAALLSAFGPHTGRKLLINDLGKQRDGETKLWQGELLREVADLKTSAEKTADGILLKVGGRYPRPGFPEQAVEGECEWNVRPSGALKVSYRYKPVDAKDSMVETGLAFSVPAALSEFRWLGQGPYAGYPGKDRLNEFGIFHLNREDLYFPGNRRGVELAFLSTPGGAGLLLTGDEMTVSVEHRGDATLFSHIASSSEKGAKDKDSKDKDTGENVANKASFSASSVKSISGKFTLVPLGDKWPASLQRWFGKPGAATPAQPRFFRTYDE